MKGVNQVIIAGNLVREPQFGEVRSSNVLCANFTLAVEKSVYGENTTVFVQVNCYGLNAEFCKQLNKGDYVFVRGELMNRKLRKYNVGSLEVRGLEIAILKKKEEQKEE